MSTSNRDADSKVCYRLGELYWKRLRLAALGAGVTPHQYARLVLVQHFEQAELLDLKDAVAELSEELREFREELLEVLG